MNLSVIILAAGQGTRMRSELPKVLHRLAGRTLLEHVYQTARSLGPGAIYIVYGYGGRKVPDALTDLEAEWVEQRRQLGTGHAVQQAIDTIPDSDQVLVLYGDVPLITSATLEELVAESRRTGLCLLTSELSDPAGYGRILRDENGSMLSIVEEKDASRSERAIREVNTGIMAVDAALLRKWLAALDTDNAQGEYYLTDIVGLAVRDNVVVHSVQPQEPVEVNGVNNRVQLAELERYYQLRQARALMLDGVSLADPYRFDLRGELQCGRDVLIDINVIVEGRVSIGDNVSIGANCHLVNAEIADGVCILPNSVIEDAVVGRGSRIGPFARIRPGTRLAEDVHVGNFVEIKNSRLASRSKVNHLSYMGDSEVGRDVNVGAGTITCNYDGADKHTTVIGDNVHIGSNTQLIAPVRIGDDVTIGAGSTITQDVEPGTLVHNRVERKTVRNWKRPEKK